nr:MAG TPA: hypothetical protein [Caudoviricetes sp.]
MEATMDQMDSIAVRIRIAMARENVYLFYPYVL